MKSLFLFLAGMCISTAAFADFAGGPSIEVGFAGYCAYEPTVGRLFGGKSGYSDTIFGPTNHGWTVYNYECTAVDLKEQRKTEPFDLLAGDEVMNLRVHFVLKVRKNEQAVKLLMENYGATPAEWYNVIQEGLRTLVRATVEAKSASDINSQRATIGDSITTATNTYLAERPIQLVAVEVGHVEYPASVQKAIEVKMAKVHELDAATKQVAIATQDGLAKVETAKADANAIRERAMGEAAATEALKQQITELYVRYLEAQAQVEAAKQPGNKTIFFFGDGNKQPPVMTYDVGDSKLDNKPK